MNKIEQAKYRMPLCPYLVVGNQRVLVHLDAFGVPHSLQWPEPGSCDRLGWRDPLDEWPYWEEVGTETIHSRCPSFRHIEGQEEFFHNAKEVWSGYLEDTNVLASRYVLSGGAQVETTTFVPPGRDVWVRHFRVVGSGSMMLRGEFFEKAVRGHAMTHLGDVHFRGAFDGLPRGAYILCSTTALERFAGGVKVEVNGSAEWTIFLCIADDLQAAVRLGEEVKKIGFPRLLEEAAETDRKWVGAAKSPTSTNPFVQKNYRRWLLSNQLEIGPQGAMMCGPRPFWSFSWPRDCSHQCAAFAVAGFLDEARSALGWHFERTPECGIHEARYRSDGSPMLLDNRPRQGDNPGLLCWAAGVTLKDEWVGDWAAQIAPNLFRMADHLVRSRDPETLLPLPEADYQESIAAESIGLSLPAAGGLLQAAWISERLGNHNRAAAYAARAAEIKQGVERVLWDDGGKFFIMSVKPENRQTDVSTCWGIPFRVWKGSEANFRSGVTRLVRDLWNREAGGVLAAPGTIYESYWMYHAAILLLGVAGTGDRKTEEEILSSLSRHCSPHGLVPEQVSRVSGNLWGCAPLPVAHAELLLYAYGQSEQDFSSSDK